MILGRNFRGGSQGKALVGRDGVTVPEAIWFCFFSSSVKRGLSAASRPPLAAVAPKDWLSTPPPMPVGGVLVADDIFGMYL